MTPATQIACGSAGAGPSNAAAAFSEWLTGKALPFWTALEGYGRMPVVEAVGLDGLPLDMGYLRLRVIARQVVVYSSACAEGLDWVRPVANETWDAFVRFFYSPASGWASQVGQHCQVTGLDFSLYDQSFAVYACACRARLDPGGKALSLARRTLRRIDELLSLRSRDQGWRREKSSSQRDQNSHMHLLEALLALHAVAPSRHTEEMIARLLMVVRDRLFDFETGTISEDFGPDWAPCFPVRVEPGHQFEWYWLLDRADKAGFVSPIPADRLFEFAIRHGFSLDCGLVVDACHPDGSVMLSAHRLWAQCEALRAATVHPDSAFGSALAGLICSRLKTTFLDPAFPGTWHDRVSATGERLSEHVPASSLYHLWEAALALRLSGQHQIAGGRPCS